MKNLKIKKEDLTNMKTFIFENTKSNCSQCASPENCRICMFQILHDEKDYTGNYYKFITQYFTDEKGCDELYDKMVSYGYYSNRKEDFYKKYVCDLEWSKTLSYCKTEPEKNKWIDSTDAKSKFTKKYPCINETSISNGKVMNMVDGTVYRINYLLNGENCWMYLIESENVENVKKYSGLIQKQDGSDSGKFSCKP